MNSDIYLLLVRDEGLSTIKKMWESGPAALAMAVPKWLKLMVMGDSLDAPFVKFIKVESVGHSMAFGSDSDQLGYGNAALDPTSPTVWQDWKNYKESGREDTGWAVAEGAAHSLWTRGHFSANRGATRTGIRDEFETGNTYLQSHLPGHGKFTFGKRVDKATPQLAFGCSAQERFLFGAFFFRRKTGLGIGGSRMPYLVIGLEKLLVSGWSLDGDAESVSLAYKQIAWAATDQIGDTNVSIPGFTRCWDVESQTGGEGGWALGLQALTVGLAALGKPIGMGLDKAFTA